MASGIDWMATINYGCVRALFELAGGQIKRRVFSLWNLSPISVCVMMVQCGRKPIDANIIRAKITTRYCYILSFFYFARVHPSTSLCYRFWRGGSHQLNICANIAASDRLSSALLSYGFYGRTYSKIKHRNLSWRNRKTLYVVVVDCSEYVQMTPRLTIW